MSTSRTASPKLGPITKGEARISRYDNYYGWSVYCHEDGCIAERWYKNPVDEAFNARMQANAELYADAHNTALSCGLLPSELLAMPREAKRLLELANAAAVRGGMMRNSLLSCGAEHPTFKSSVEEFSAAYDNKPDMTDFLSTLKDL